MRTTKASQNDNAGFLGAILSHLASTLTRVVAIGFLVAAACGIARGQSLGYEINSTDETVTVFGSATTTLSAQGFSDATLQTVTFPTQSGQSAPKLIGLAVAPALGTATARYVYVTDQQNNQLWAFDVSTISLGKAAAQPVSVAAGSCSTPLFSSPGAIAIANPSAASAFAYVANGNGTVTIINLATSTCAGKVTLSGTITAIATSSAPSPDMKKVFVITSTPALWSIDTSSQTAAQLTLNGDAADDSFTLVNPVSLYVQDEDDDTDVCYYLTIGDKGASGGTGNGKVFLAATPDTSSGATGCVLVGPIETNQATLLQPVSLSVVGTTLPTAPNPVSLASSFASAAGAGSIYVADSGNKDVWEIDCSAAIAAGNITTDYPCNPAAPHQVNGGNNTPTSVALTLAQTQPSEVALIIAQYLYVTETTSSGTVLQYFNVGGNGGTLGTLTSSSATIGNGPSDLTFTGVDPNDTPVTFFGEAYYNVGESQTRFQGPVWIMPVTGELTALGTTMVSLSSAAPSMSLNFGSYTINSVTTSINCAQFGVEGTPGSTCASPSSGTNTAADAGTNGIGGQTSTTNTEGANPLNLPASVVFTVTVDGCSQATCPGSPGATDTILQQQVIAGADCTTLDVTASGNTALTQVAIGQTVTAAVSCVAPLEDQLTGTINWGDNTSSSSPTVVNTTVTPVPGGSYEYEAAVLTFTHTYATASSTPYSVSVGSVTDSTEEVPADVAGISPASVTVNGIALSISPSTSVAVQVAKTQQFTATVDYDINGEGVTWSLLTNGVACTSTATCGSLTGGVLGGVTANPVTYTAPTNPISVTLQAKSAETNQASVTASVAITVQTGAVTQQPSCTAAESPNPVQTLTTATVTLTCTASANDALTATINWGDSPAASSTATATASVSGSATITLTHSYTTAGTYSSLSAGVSDANYKITVPVPSFTVLAPPAIVPGSTSVTLAAGQSATFNLTFSGSDVPNVTFSSFSCSGLPSGATCTFSPASLTLSATGTGTEQVTVTLTGGTTSLFPLPSGTSPSDTRPVLLFATLFGLPAFGLLFVSLSAPRGGLRKQRAWQALCLVLMISMLLWTGACSSVNSSSGTSSCTGCANAGTYQVTVTATSLKPALTASTVFTLNVAQ